MGQVHIEIPQEVNRSYQVDDSAFGKRLLDDLEKYYKSDETSDIIPPKRDSMTEDGDAILGIWSDRPESAEEIARSIRDGNKGEELETISLEYPYDLDDVDETEAIGIWADREESAQEIARTIREKNRKGT